MVIDQFGSIVAVNALQGEGQPLLDSLHGFEHMSSGFTPARPALDPARFDIGGVKGEDKLTARVTAAMGDQVNLHQNDEVVYDCVLGADPWSRVTSGASAV